MPEEIFDDDTVSISVIDPKHMVLGMTDVIDLKQGLQFAEDHKRKESVNCHRLVRAPFSDVHDLGIKLEGLINQRKASEGKPKVTYVGYKSSPVIDVRTVCHRGVHFEVSHEPELENYAHCDLTMLIPKDINPKSVKNEACRAVCEVFRTWVNRP